MIHKNSAALEIFRWGYAHVPGSIFYYARELELDMEDIGIVSAIFYTFEAKSKPLFQTGINVGQILQCCPSLTKNKLSRNISKLAKANVVDIVDGNSKNFTDKMIFLEPLLSRLEDLVIRDHPDFSNYPNNEELDNQIDNYRNQVEQLQLALEAEKGKHLEQDKSVSNCNYKKLADFIASKTGNLMSVKMGNELKHWLNDMSFAPEFLFCLLEMCFERNISNPRQITKIVSDVKQYSISSLEGLELYFNNNIKLDKFDRLKDFDPEIIEFGEFTGIDMGAEARKAVYYKWRYDWAFSHKMIIKAGEIMCQRTRNGGLEYIDSVLKNWMSKEIRSVEEAEKEMADYKSRTKKDKTPAIKKTNTTSNDYEIYVPPSGTAEGR